MSKPAIICIDDEPTVLESLKLELKRVLGQTCLIETAEGGEEALELLQELQQDDYEVALVLADYIMPDIRGDELLGRIHTLSPHTLNIMISGQADLEAVANAIRCARLYRYIAKPWQPDNLKTTVVEAIQSYLQDRKLELQTGKLELANTELRQSIIELKQAKATLKRKAEREHALGQVVQAIRSSLDLNTIFSKTVSEVGKLLQADRVDIVRLVADHNCWLTVADYRKNPEWPSAVGLAIADAKNPIAKRLRQLEMVKIDDAQTVCQDSINRALAEKFPGAWLLIPIDCEAENLGTSVRTIWGSLSMVKQTPQPLWQDWEVELAQAIADQLAIAIQQSELYEQVQHLNADLEHQVQERTKQLQQALEFEALLKRITDKVRDSLDESQILQTAVQALATGLNVLGCDAALYDMTRRTSTICYESIGTDLPSARGISVSLGQRPDIYRQLLRGQYAHFCVVPNMALPPRNLTHQVTILSCPLMDDQGALGDLWLFKPPQDGFNELEIRLVQQVANQCAIALRQSRLYQAAQAQVVELEHLNTLKDDFLSSVSHELRSPMTNISMAIEMLSIILEPLGLLNAQSGIATRYFQVLRDECRRETQLINDLLDLARLEAGMGNLCLTTIDLKHWLPHLLEPFVERSRNQQQQLVIDIADSLPMLTTDLFYLERALTELVHNACKYTPTGEKIVVSVQPWTPYPLEQPRAISSHPAYSAPSQSMTLRQTAALKISVSNSGIEIPEPEHDRVFDKFYRIISHDQRNQGGTGLGLALVRRQIEQLQGSIEVNSQQGWTVFTIQLPVIPTEQLRSDPSDSVH